jgi:CDP-diacylglycerol---glycerol-3-phosphate 3-phosphatidyltransferase
MVHRLPWKELNSVTMASIYDLKPAFQNQLRPLVNTLAQRGITPNQITLSAIALSIAYGLCLAHWPEERMLLGLFPLVLLVRMGLNAIDGMLARDHQLTSPLGQILNELGDVIADAALYLPFARLNPIWVVGIVLLAMVTEMAGTVGQTISGTRRYDGPMGKSDRAVAFSGIALLLASGVPLVQTLPWLWGLIVGLLLWTLRNRIVGALQETSQT